MTLNMPSSEPLGRFTEDQLENAIVALFERLGYAHVVGDQLTRRLDDVLLRDVLEGFLRNQYADQRLTDVEIQKIISRIDSVSHSPLYDGNREAFQLVCEGFDFIRDDKNLPAFHVNFVDFDNPDANDFKIVNQFTVEGARTRRPDALVFLNGIPVAIFEFKTAIEESKTIFDAWKQITIRYTRDVPALLKYSFLSVISDGANTRMGSIFTPYEYFYAWNKIDDDEPHADGIASLHTMIAGAFSKERLLAILRDFVFYPDNVQKPTAIITRYPQFFAANKMFANIKEHLKPGGDGKGGTYFGATGSGKTYTMMFLSRLLMLRDPQTFKNPTVIVLVDREDLDSQISELFVNASSYLHETDVRSIESRADLETTLKNRPSGGVYITTIQKFCESTGLLSDRTNIICISDEAHRTQTSVGSKLKTTEEGVFVTYGLAKYLRDAFPNATYCGVTGTPIDETIAVFGDVVDSYTMRESTEDGITVRIAYEPRLARVIVSDDKAKEIQEYYDKAAELGATEEAIEDSQRAMSAMRQIIADPDRLRKVATDIITHYEALISERPDVVQKAMIVCMDRPIAFAILQEILKLRPEWVEEKKSENDAALSSEELSDLVALPKVNLVVTQGKDDPQDLWGAAGTKEHRQMLDRQFKNTKSNFKIAIVVDMWITGFDVPSLSVMYIDKPIRRHTLIQTISRVNRVYEGKGHGIVVDYIGIRKQMLQALKTYGGKQESPIDEIEYSLKVFRNQLALIKELLSDFDASGFFAPDPLGRLMCLNEAAEFVQQSTQMQERFMALSKRMKSAYTICFPTGELTDDEVAYAQFYMAVRSILYKQTKGDAPDVETMNRAVEKMVAEAIQVTGIESILDEEKSFNLFSEEMFDELKKVKLPITKFNALLKLLKKSINEYRRTNKVQAAKFDERLKAVVDAYNSRDKQLFVSDVVSDFVDDLSDQLIDILKDLQDDENSFKELGTSYEEKAFYDILINVRDTHKFVYDDDKCLNLAKKIKALVDDKSQYADWSTRADIKSQLNKDLTILLYENGYPPEWDEEVFEQVMEQAENFKKYED
ncbi:type I restriction endonuclease subunit R [Corynebacterium diphtheriae]|uniref:type I restriction endonuclease subunit R n=1 Tax=Corynebacterium diphtheriae TaxID=1717 RepID=UPI000B4BEB72|nr:HsdR family type I site-specific deoxyribonuclease [Corynebacterium diphtheriae]OWN39909.1 type I restriction endonuclease [Corynebacterium diphtheriae bv. gravis]OWN67777.1 type I restriction endonuclease [Corynebacterium diphtheriae bv. gravis]OWO21731.1 type I restriction endonuclease [Corynebacterium diphtheriae bv. gravis]OWO51981.1 type I restriction endonuclease [Corynebacterium diphtheriae bv. gravis]CAB0526113.1 type I restriction endonuclease subunit R [Corynebacterium diphtheriae